MLILDKFQISKQMSYKHAAARKGNNRNDLTAKRRADFKIKLSKILGTFNYSFFFVKSSDFSRTLGGERTSFKLFRSKYSTVQDKNKSRYVKSSSFKMARRFLSITKKAFF